MILIAAIIEIKRRNPNFGYQRIADQISLAFDIEINKDVVRRVLAKHYRPKPGSSGPSWLTFLGHSKDRIRSIEKVPLAIVLPRFVSAANGGLIANSHPTRPKECYKQWQLDIYARLEKRPFN